MDDFSLFGGSFHEALENIENLFFDFQEACLTLIDKKCRLMCKASVVLGSFVSDKDISVDQVKIEVILHIPTPKTQSEVRGFLRHVGITIDSLKNFLG